MGRTSQRKGRTAELELVRLFQSHGIPAEPGQAVSYGATPDIVGVDGVHIECKRAETLRLNGWHKPSGMPSDSGTVRPPCSFAVPVPRGAW